MGATRMSFQLKTQVPTEKQEHLCLMQWIALQPKIREIWIHIANEYDGGVIGGFNRKCMGVRKGVSDFYLPLPVKPYHGLWIELKRRSGSKVSLEQQFWIDKMNDLGYLAVICYGFDQAVNTIN